MYLSLLFWLSINLTNVGKFKISKEKIMKKMLGNCVVAFFLVLGNVLYSPYYQYIFGYSDGLTRFESLLQALGGLILVFIFFFLLLKTTTRENWNLVLTILNLGALLLVALEKFYSKFIYIAWPYWSYWIMQVFCIFLISYSVYTLYRLLLMKQR